MEESLNTFDKLESVCRTCMGKTSLISIFVSNKKYSIKLSEMLYYCAAVEANEGDNLPPYICKRCKASLLALYKFKYTAKNSEAILKQILIDNKKTRELSFEELENSSSNVGPKLEESTFLKEEEDCNLNDGDLDNNYKPDLNITSTDVNDESLVTLNGKDEKGHDHTSKSIVVKRKKKIIKRKLKQKPQTPSFQCEACGKFLSCRSNLVQHMRRHTGEKPFSCDFCDKKFARSEHVTIHRRIHTGERPHVCSVCQKSFVQYAALTAHFRTHSGERPHMCAICGKSFTQSISLTYHTRTHTGETPYKCEICNKGFAHSGNLNIHMRFHNNERPYACTICQRRFVTSSHLSVHIKQHTGDRPHQCNLCGKAFARSEHLKDHLVIHTGQKPHACNLCTKRYTQSSHLNRHMKTHKT